MRSMQMGCKYANFLASYTKAHTDTSSYELHRKLRLLPMRIIVYNGTVWIAGDS